MKTNSIAAAVLNIASADSTKEALKRLVNMGSREFQDFVTEMILGVKNVPETLAREVIRDGVTLTLDSVRLDTIAVNYTFEDEEERFFETEYDAERGIERRNRWAGSGKQTETHPIAAKIKFTNSGGMTIYEWIELSKQGE